MTANISVVRRRDGQQGQNAMQIYTEESPLSSPRKPLLVLRGGRSDSLQICQHQNVCIRRKQCGRRGFAAQYSAAWPSRIDAAIVIVRKETLTRVKEALGRVRLWGIAVRMTSQRPAASSQRRIAYKVPPCHEIVFQTQHPN